ncbi:MAG TPA: coniferyl aldehyde dehydrogenase, partial [Xanthobacteraceae bacterium]|nr:coniferyl aldehyde dehydrogenase [Xanthobacteraceae bacterium]
MRATFDAQRSAFARENAPSLQQRRSDLTKLRDAVEKNADRLAAAISADFGNRSRHETAISEVVPVLAAIRYARRHLRGWMRPKRVAVSLELLPGR